MYERCRSDKIFDVPRIANCSGLNRLNDAEHTHWNGKTHDKHSGEDNFDTSTAQHANVETSRGKEGSVVARNLSGLDSAFWFFAGPVGVAMQLVHWAKRNELDDGLSSRLQTCLW